MDFAPPVRQGAAGSPFRIMGCPRDTMAPGAMGSVEAWMEPQRARAARVRMDFAIFMCAEGALQVRTGGCPSTMRGGCTGVCDRLLPGSNSARLEDQVAGLFTEGLGSLPERQHQPFALLLGQVFGKAGDLGHLATARQQGQGHQSRDQPDAEAPVPAGARIGDLGEGFAERIELGEGDWKGPAGRNRGRRRIPGADPAP